MGGPKKPYVFSGRFFRPTSNVNILETVYLNDLKFKVRIVLGQVPFQIIFGQTVSDIGSLAEKNDRKKCKVFFGPPFTRYFLAILVISTTHFLLIQVISTRHFSIQYTKI